MYCYPLYYIYCCFPLVTFCSLPRQCQRYSRSPNLNGISFTKHILAKCFLQAFVKIQNVISDLKNSKVYENFTVNWVYVRLLYCEVANFCLIFCNWYSISCKTSWDKKIIPHRSVAQCCFKVKIHPIVAQSQNL